MTTEKASTCGVRFGAAPEAEEGAEVGEMPDCDTPSAGEGTSLTARHTANKQRNACNEIISSQTHTGITCAAAWIRRLLQEKGQ